MEHPSRLSKTFVERVSEAGRYGDGRGGFGLSLLVKARSAGGWSKTFSQRIIIDDAVVNIGLGPYPIVSLPEAREAALANRRAVWNGIDPRRHDESVPTFAAGLDHVLAIHAETWRDGGKSEAQWRASLRDYAMDRLGSKRVDRITTADVLAVLTPIWNDKRETARRVRQRIGAVMKWAIAAGHRVDNPAGDALGAALPSGGHKATHFRALRHQDLAAVLGRIRATKACLASVLAFDFLALTACRSGEVRGATWAEMDLDARTWTIPAARMKAKVEHRVPLSSGALDELAKAREIADASGLVFPAPTGRPLSDNTLSKLLRENGIECVPHGIRSTFRDWAAESGQGREVAEQALGHTVHGVEGAYFRSDLYTARVELMQAWCDYLAE